MSWKKIREVAKKNYKEEIDSLSVNEVVRALALKGAIRTLDEKFATADDKAKVVAGEVDLPSLGDLAATASRQTLADRAIVVRRAVLDLIRRQEIGYDDADYVLGLLVKPTKDNLAEAENFVTAHRVREEKDDASSN